MCVKESCAGALPIQRTFLFSCLFAFCKCVLVYRCDSSRYIMSKQLSTSVCIRGACCAVGEGDARVCARVGRGVCVARVPATAAAIVLALLGRAERAAWSWCGRLLCTCVEPVLHLDKSSQGDWSAIAASLIALPKLRTTPAFKCCCWIFNWSDIAAMRVSLPRASIRHRSAVATIRTVATAVASLRTLPIG